MGILATGTLAQANDTVSATSLDNNGSMGIVITGNMVGTIKFQGSLDGLTFLDTFVLGLDGTFVTSTTSSTGSFIVNPAGLKTIQVIATIYTSGTATITIQLGGASALINSLSTMVGNTDGSRIGNTGDRLKVDSLPSVATDRSGSGTITSGTTPNDVVEVNTQGMSTVRFLVSGTWVGTMRAEGLVNGTWKLATVSDASQSVFAASSSNGEWYMQCGGFSKVRLRMSSYTSGTANVEYSTGIGVGGPGLVWNTNATSLKISNYARKADATDVPMLLTANQELKTSDGLRSGGVYGNLALSTANTTYEAKVGGARLSNRKALTITPLDDVYWGYDSSVTTSTGTPLFKNQSLILSIDPDSTCQIWLVASGNSKNARITEST